MKKTTTVLDVIYKDYNNKINMSLDELKLWSRNPVSKKTSKSRKPLNMAIKLKAKPKNKWGVKEIKWVLKVLSYFKKVEKLKHKNLNAYNKDQISLKNWGYDIKKQVS